MYLHPVHPLLFFPFCFSLFCCFWLRMRCVRTLLLFFYRICASTALRYILLIRRVRGVPARASTEKYNGEHLLAALASPAYTAPTRPAPAPPGSTAERGSSAR